VLQAVVRDRLPRRGVRDRAVDRSPGAVAVYITGDAKFERRFGRADGVSRATNRLPAGAPDLRRGPFTVYIRCEKFTRRAPADIR
jgi:hypothetical protein